MEQAIVEVQHLKKSYGDQSVLKDLTLSVREGTIAALLGPNGAGKTTLVRILSTLIKANGGTATIAGYDVARQPDAIRSITSLTGQYAAVDELLTGEENLRLAARLLRLDRKASRVRIDQLLEQFGLTGAASKPVKSYSGGMRRKLDLAMSLLSRPRILFLDEPTTGLDPRSRNTLWSIVRELATDGVTVFLTTQYLEEADQLADRISLIDLGHIIAEGTANELKQSLGHGVLELNFPDNNATLQASVALKAERATNSPNNHTLRLPTDGSPAQVYRFLDILREAAIPVDRMDLHKPTLDDVFLKLTGHHTPQQEAQP